VFRAHVEENNLGSDQHSRRATMALSPETLIFVDIDGVLNVGIRDGGGKMAPISFSLDNLNKALGVLQKMQHGGEIDVESANTVDKIISVALHSLEDVDEESTTYHELLTNSPHAPGNFGPHLHFRQTPCDHDPSSWSSQACRAFIDLAKTSICQESRAVGEGHRCHARRTLCI